MCILFLRLLQSSKEKEYKLILATNRDEQYRRPAKIAHFWTEDENVFGGKDMTQGRENGTWLAMSKTGKIGVLLSAAGEVNDANKLGRGPIVAEFVKGDVQDDKYLEYLVESGDRFNKFHLVTVSISSSNTKVMHFTNSPTTKPENVRQLTSDCVGVGNSPLVTPYQKVVNGQKRFESIVQELGTVDRRDELVDSLLKLLKWEQPHYPDQVLKAKVTNIPETYMKPYSAVCVNIPGAEYGTRTHTIILVDNENKVEFLEWTLVPASSGDVNKQDWHFTKQQFNLVQQ